MTAAEKNEDYETIKSIFRQLDANEPNAASNIRDAFHTVWDQLYELGEHLAFAATIFDGQRKGLLLQEYQRIQNLMYNLHESCLPEIMPDDALD